MIFAQEEDTTLLFHAELCDTMSAPLSTGSADTAKSPTLYATFLESRPEQLETDAVSLITALQRSHPALRCHIVHLSSAAALPIIREAKSSGLSLTVETCFHYLCLSSDRIPDGRPEFKCCPPIRDTNNKELLWEALQEGLIDCIVSDHSPCVAELKKVDEGNLMNAWGGISTLGLGLSLLWTEAQARHLTMGQIVQWTCTNTAAHAGLSHTKGALSVGLDGDFIVWNPNVNYQVLLPVDEY